MLCSCKTTQTKSNLSPAIPHTSIIKSVAKSCLSSNANISPPLRITDTHLFMEGNSDKKKRCRHWDFAANQIMTIRVRFENSTDKSIWTYSQCLDMFLFPRKYWNPVFL